MSKVVDDETCIQRLVVNEGLMLKPYYCPAGYLTIGIGRNLETNPLTEDEKNFIGHNVKEGITNEQAFYLCRNDIKKVKAELDKFLPWWRELNLDRQFVMIDLMYNLGLKTFMTFKKTLSSIAQGYYIRAAEQLLQSKYAKQVGIRAERNAYALRTGEWVANPPKYNK